MIAALLDPPPVPWSLGPIAVGSAGRTASSPAAIVAGHIGLGPARLHCRSHSYCSDGSTEFQGQ